MAKLVGSIKLICRTDPHNPHFLIGLAYRSALFFLFSCFFFPQTTFKIWVLGPCCTYAIWLMQWCPIALSRLNSKKLHVRVTHYPLRKNINYVSERLSYWLCFAWPNLNRFSDSQSLIHLFSFSFLCLSQLRPKPNQTPPPFWIFVLKIQHQQKETLIASRGTTCEQRASHS